MPAVLTVTQIRDHLYRAAGGPKSAGAGRPSAALLGRLFHELFARLAGPDEAVNMVRPLLRADATEESWTTRLVSHCYAWHVAPALARQQSELQGDAERVLSFWDAAKGLCAYLVSLAYPRFQKGESIEAIRRGLFLASEEEVCEVLTDPSWSDAVQVEGRLDALLGHPTNGSLCVVELKLGRGSPEVDLCQAALYHLLLSRARLPRFGFPRDKTRASRSLLDIKLALLSFEPGLRETFFEGEALHNTQAHLKELVGHLAGVVGAASRAVLRPPTRATRASSSVSPSMSAGPRRTRSAQATPEEPGPTALDGRFADLARRLVDAFREFDKPLRLVGEPMVGPAFVRFFAVPEKGVWASGVESDRLARSIWVRLATSQPPGVAIRNGRVVIDIERSDRETIPWSAIAPQLPNPPAPGERVRARFPVGLAVDGTLHWADLAEPESCHVLVAGTTGSGKTEWLRAMLASLLASQTPETLRLVLIDPKRLAFHLFEGSPFLFRDVIYPDGAQASVLSVFDELIAEMDERYKRLADAGVPDVGLLSAEVAPETTPLPRIVVMCDEYADLILQSPTGRREVERRLARLAARSRAAGLHLVLATQRPSREVVKGLIDSNIPARVALRVTKELESRLILGSGGAERLLGKGDLLFRDLGDAVRLQAPLVSDEELRGLAGLSPKP